MSERIPPVRSASIRAHRRQLFWQILLPLILAIGLVAAAATLIAAASLGGSGAPRLWADVALIWLLAPMLLAALGLVVVLAGLIYGLARLLRVLPTFTGKVQQVSHSLLAGVERLADGLLRPVLWVRQVWAGLTSLIGGPK